MRLLALVWVVTVLASLLRLAMERNWWWLAAAAALALAVVIVSILRSK